MDTATQHDVQTYAIDNAHSRLGFVVRHMGFSKVRGSFKTYDGTVRMKGEDLSTLEAEVTIQAASITTNDEARDKHLRSEDFFEVETYPTITFESTEVRDISGDAFSLVGTLTMHGVTQTITLDAEFLGTGQDPWGGTRAAFEAKTTINRKDFGLNWNTLLETGGVLVSENVDLVLEIQAVAQNDDA